MSTGWAEIETFIEDTRARGRRSSTLTGYRSHLRSLEEAVDVADPWRVSPAEVRAWLDERGASERASWRVARRFYAWGVERGRLRVSPVPDHIAEDVRARRRAIEEASAAFRRWREPLERYTVRLQAAGVSERTIRLHLCKVRQFARVHPDPWAVTADDVAAWLANTSWAPETRKSTRNVLRRFYDESARPTGVPSPVAGIGSPRIPRRLPRPAPRDVLEDALERASDRLRLMMLLGAYAGLRVGEISRVRPCSDVQEGFLYVHGKGGDERRVPLHPRLEADLEVELAQRRAGRFGVGFWPYDRGFPGRPVDAFLFPNGAGGHLSAPHVSVLVSRELPDGMTAHMLRHRFATDAYRSSRDLRAVQELLGHTTPRTTAIYTLTSDADLRAAVDGIQ